MDITINSVRNVLNTLPIGYYLGRSIKCELTPTNTSYYSPVEDKINIGFNPIKTVLEREFVNKNNVSIEFMVRGLLYHELSHVLITPDSLFDRCNRKTKDIVNIFEDERIETVFEKYYMNVNFKQLVIIYNDYNNPDRKELKTARNAWFDLVRFRSGDSYYLGKVEKLINKYYTINTKTSPYTVYQYVEDIIDLYNEFAKDFERENPDADKDPAEGYDGQTSVYIIIGGKNDKNDDNNSESTELPKNAKIEGIIVEDSEDESENDTNDSKDSESGLNIPISGDSEDEESEEKKSSKSSESKDNAENSKDDSSNASEDAEDNEISKEEIDPALKEEIDKILEKMNVPIMIQKKKAEQQALNTSVNQYYDAQITLKLEQIINQKLKKKKLNGAAINSYSGVFNPRSVVRDDYKWWSQQNRNGHVRQYSKVHFNFFLDNSGSFDENEDKMNTFLQSLNRINNVDFDFDVITINNNIVEWDKMYEFKCCGGNVLDDRIEPVFKKHQKRNCMNYNIVLFDGDAHSNEGYSRRHFPSTGEAFRHFDTNNTIIISDPDNEGYIKDSVHTAKVKITKNYCQDFINCIFELLEIML